MINIRPSTLSRQLDLTSLLSKKSCFLFGARATGKTTLVRTQLGEKCLFINLLRSTDYTRLLADPSQLEAMIDAQKQKIIVIDEIQKIPALLDEVHRLIEEKKIRFLLTGSSARKLKRSHANMLAGRAWKAELWPLTSAEIPNFNLERALRYGTLPAIWTSEYPDEDLDAYVSTYLKEEIEMECQLRNLPAFSRFLKVAALSSGQLINYAQMASDAAVSETTLKSHFQILQDTLLGHLVEPFVETKKRKAIATSKFYLFDNGVKHMLAQTQALDRNSELYGASFEAFIAGELRAFLSYRRIKKPLAYWRSQSRFEVDFVIGNQVAVEVKAAKTVTEKHLRGLAALAEEKIFDHFYLVSQDPVARTADVGSGRKALLIPWKEFLRRLWMGEIFG